MGLFEALKMGHRMVKDMLNLRLCRKCKASLKNNVIKPMDKQGLHLKDLEKKESLPFLQKIKEKESKMFCRHCKHVIDSFCERNGIKI